MSGQQMYLELVQLVVAAPRTFFVSLSLRVPIVSRVRVIFLGAVFFMGSPLAS
jgi:hypothetical protein